MSEVKVNKISPRSGTAFTLGDSGDTFTVPSGAGLTLTDSTLLLPTTITSTTEVKTNKISPATGTAFALGDSGDTFTVPSGATIVNSGTATGFGGDNTPAFSAYRSGTSFAVGDGAYTTVVWNSELYDTAGDYNTSTGEFTCSSTGKYLMGAFVLKSVATAMSRFIMSIQEDGSHFIFGETFADSTAGFPTVFALGARTLTSGNVYTAKIYQNSGGSMDVSAGTDAGSFFAFKLIGV